MKKIFTLCSLVTIFFFQKSNAQFSENFETDSTALKSNCWQFFNMEWTSNPAYVITGTGSLLSNPGASMREVKTPALTITTGSLLVSFNYKLTNNLNGGTTRAIEIGLIDPSNNYTALDTIMLDNSSPLTVQSYSNTFTSIEGLRKIVIKTSGSGGGGNARIVIDDLNSDATSMYAPGTFCNSAPVAVDDLFTGILGNPVYGNVITNDNEPDNEVTSSAVVVSSPDGTVALNANGTFSFTPSVTFTGTTTTFTYHLTDNGFDPLTSNTATVTISYFAAAPLPVKLNNFQGSKNKSNVQLQWNVSMNEIANTFEVERSTDGKNFSAAALMFGTEKSGNETYSYNEINEDAKVYYRLKMVDKSDVLTYSKILVFNSNGKNTKTLDIIGNSVSDKLTVSFQSDANNAVELRILDMNGKMIAKQTVKASKGNNLVSISLPSAMMAGMYIASLSSENENRTAKFIKQ